VAESLPEGTPQSRGGGSLRSKRPGWERFGVWAHVLVLLVAVPGLALLTASADTRVFFGDNVYHADLDAFEATFTQSNNILLLLRHNGERIADSPKFADLLREATTGAWKLPHVMRVDSLATHPHIVGNGDDFNVTPILDLLCPGACDPNQAHLIDDPMLQSRLVSKDGTTVGIYMVFDLPLAKPQIVQNITGAVRAFAADLVKQDPGVTAYFVGAITMMDAYSEAAKRDMSTLNPLVLLVMLAILVVTLGEARTVGLLLVTGIFAAAAAMGTAGWLGVQLNAATSIAAVIIITLVIANGKYLMLTFLVHMSGTEKDARRAAQIAVDLNAKPIVLMTGTSLIGFLSMNFADAPPLRQLGNLIAVGLFVGTTALLIVVPTILARFRNVSVLRSASVVSHSLEFLAGPRSGVVAACAGVIVVAAVLGISHLSINDNFVKNFDESFEFRRAADFTEEHMSGPHYIDLQISSGQPDGIYDPNFIVLLHDLTQWLREQPLVASAVSLADVVGELALNFKGSDDLGGLTHDEIAQYVLTYELSLSAGQNINDLYDSARQSSRISTLLGGGNSRSVIALEKSIYEWFRQHGDPNYKVVVTGISIPVAHMSLLNAESMVYGNLFSLALIAGLVGIYFKSMRILAIAALAMCLPIAMGFGLWGWLVGDMGLAASVISAMTIGIVVDDAIHIIYRYRHARTVMGETPQESLRLTMLTVGNAVFSTSVALAAGFALLGLSGFAVNRALGLCTMFVIISGLIVDVILVPRLLAWIDREEELAVVST
jgi:predicted RND superfamily exporter protein